MVDKTREMLGEIEGHYDDYFTTWKELKLYKALNGLGVKGNHAKIIIKHANRNIDEIQHAIDGTDKQLEEGYSNFTKPQLKKLVKWWESLIADCNTIIDDAKTLRKYNTARNKRLRALDIKPPKKYNTKKK
jgi:hypothetical protein